LLFAIWKLASLQVNSVRPEKDEIFPNPCIEKSFNLSSNSSDDIVVNSVSIPDIIPKYLPSFSTKLFICPSCWSVLIISVEPWTVDQPLVPSYEIVLKFLIAEGSWLKINCTPES